MLTRELAQEFAREWVEAWNAHDLDRILSHYSDDFEMTTPFIVTIFGEPSGTLKGKEMVREYWRQALERIPDLHFELIETLFSVNSIAIYYRAVLGKRAVEWLLFGPDKKVCKAVAHYNA